jgi:hypothetical protein
MHSTTLPPLNKVIIKCKIHYIVHLQSTFSPVHMEVRDSDVLAWVQGEGKMSQVPSVFGQLDFTVLEHVLTWCAF